MEIEILLKILGATALALGPLFLLAFWRKILKWKKTRKKSALACLKIRPPKNSEINPGVFEHFFSALHAVWEQPNFFGKLFGKRQEKCSFEIANIAGQVHFFIRCRPQLVELVSSQIWAHSPQVEIEKIPDFADFLWKKNLHPVGTDLHFAEADLWPIKRISQFEDRIAKVVQDPIAGITHSLLNLPKRESAVVQICASPIATTSFRRRGLKLLKILSGGFLKNHPRIGDFFERKFLTMTFASRLAALPALFFFWILRRGHKLGDLQLGENESDVEVEMSRTHDRENEMTAGSDKISKLAFACGVRVVHFANFKNPAKVKEIAGSFRQFSVPQLNGLVRGKIGVGRRVFNNFKSQKIPSQMILNVEELATMFHMPNKTVQTPSIDWVECKKLEPPRNLPAEKANESLTLLGQSNFRGTGRIFGIKEDDRRRHLYIVGKTGMGKTTLLENMIFSDMRRGKGVAVIDPHGDLADAVLNFVPKNRTNDVVLFDPSDREFPVSFNMLECKDSAHRHLVASGVLGVFKKIFAESWGPRLEHILRNTLLALIEAPGTTMLGVMRMLVDGDFRQQILKNVTDPMVLSFWENEFGAWRPQQVTEAISPIQNKVGQFLSNSLLRNILGQPKGSIDLRFAMDRGKIIVINLSKGKIGEDNSAMLGAMLVTKFQLDVMSRADLPENERRDFYLFVDEFQNFATDAFATILSEARKYRLNLTVANQYLAQMPDEVRDAVFGNVGTMISFQTGFDDAESLANQFGGEAAQIDAADIGNLPKFKIYLRLMIDGQVSRVFSADTLMPPKFEIEKDRIEKILKVCRQKFSTPRDKVELKIGKWISTKERQIEKHLPRKKK